MQQKYFDVLYALQGDQTVIQDAVDPSGGVSFTEGWGYNYQRDQTTDPLAMDIDRSTMNWLFYSITQNIQQYQQNGVPEYIFPSNNNGTVYPYLNGAVIRFQPNTSSAFQLMVCVTANASGTTQQPTDTGQTDWVNYINRPALAADIAGSNWNTLNDRYLTPLTGYQLVAKYVASINLSQFISGQIVPYAGFSAPTGTLATNGAAVSRTTYAKLFAAIGTTYGVGDGSTTFNLPLFQAGFTMQQSGSNGNFSGAVGAAGTGSVVTHSHVASSDTQGTHTHTATNDSQGVHSHNVSTGSESAQHDHSQTLASVSVVQGSVSILCGTSVNPTITYGTTGTESASHSHTGTTDSQGAHIHNITVASAGAHSHNITVNASGGGWNIPVGLAINFFIAF